MLGATVLMFGLVAYGVWSARATANDLQAAKADARQLQSALKAEDDRVATVALADLQGHVQAAHDRSDGPLWGLASVLPGIGDDVSAVRTIAAVGDDLSHGALAELAGETGSSLRDRLAPRDGRVDIAAVEDLRPLVGRARRSLDGATGRLRSIDATGLTSQVQPAYDEFASAVASAASAMGSADRAVQVLPTMLGKDGPRRYLVLFENNAEIRATGGLPGAYGLVTAEDGRLSLTKQGAPADIGRFERPVLPQSEAEQALYFEQIGIYLQDTNFTPEFPRTAALVREMWRRAEGQPLDGVMSMDVVALSYLLRATGPITVPGGVTLTADNAVDELLNGVYFRLDTNERQDRFFRDVAKLIFDGVSDGVDSAAELIDALSQSAVEGRLHVHDFDARVQRVLAGTTIAGELESSDPRVPQVGVYLNDATGSKMSYYLRTRARLRAEGCAGGVQQLSGLVDLTYTGQSPPVAELNEFITGPGVNGTPKGEQLVLMRVYGPEGGQVESFRLDGEPLEVETVTDRGRQVVTVVVQLGRGDSVRVTWRVRSRAGQDRPTELSITPGLFAAPGVSRTVSRCSGDT